MPGISGVLQNLRAKGYGSSGAEDSAASAGDRVLELSDEEMQLLPPSKPGEEVCLSVYGTVENGEFRVTRVEAEGEEKEGEGGPTAEDVMGLPSRAMPSPS